MEPQAFFNDGDAASSGHGGESTAQLLQGVRMDASSHDAEASAVAGVLATLGAPMPTRTAPLARAATLSEFIESAPSSASRRSGGVRRSVSGSSAGSAASEPAPSRSRRSGRDSGRSGPIQWTIKDESALAGQPGEAPPVPPQRMHKPRTFVFHPLTPSSMSQILHYDDTPSTNNIGGRSSSTRNASPKPPTRPVSPRPLSLPTFPQQVYLSPGSTPGVTGQPQAVLVQTISSSHGGFAQAGQPGPPVLLGADGAVLPAALQVVTTALQATNLAGDGTDTETVNRGREDSQSLPPAGSVQLLPAIPIQPGAVLPGMLPILLPAGQTSLLVPNAPSNVGTPAVEDGQPPGTEPPGTVGRRVSSRHLRHASGSSMGAPDDTGVPASPGPRRYSFVNVTSAITAKLAADGPDAGASSKQKRKPVSPAQLKELNAAFRKSSKLSGADRDDLAKRLGMSAREVQAWFQSKQRTKPKTTRQNSGIRPPQPLPMPMPDEQQGEDESDPTPLGFPRVRRTRSALSAVTFVEQEVLDRNDVEHVQFGHDSGSSGTASPIASAETGAGSPNMDISSPPHSPPSLPGMGGSLLLPREQSGVDLLAMVALQEQENSAGTDTPRERTISRWMTSTTVGSDDSDLTRKCSTNSSGSVTIATLDTRRFSIGSGILDALEDIRLSEQQFEDEDGGTKGLKRSWSAREAARPARGDAMSDYEAAERRDSSPNRINPIKRAQSSRHPLSNQF